MAIKLPRDAESREIPLDTEVLYDKEGKRREVDWYTYYPDKDRWDVVLADSSAHFSPHNLSLTQPDSWEKLEEDLSNGMFGASPGCSYAGNEAYSCDKCCFESARHCTRRIFTDIRNRIRNLRGED